MQYKLVVLDMDGTLLDNNHQVSFNNKESIMNLLNKGINFILASGRPYESIYPYVKDLGLHLPIIAANGAVVKCPITQEVFHSSGLPMELTKEIIEYGKKNNFTISLYYEDEVHTFDEKMVDVHWELEKIKASLVDNIFEEKSINKLIYKDNPLRIEEAFNYLERKYQNQLYVTRSDAIYLDVMKIGTSKGKALSKVMNKLGVTREEVIAMGNSFNDLAMFEVVGHAIAMDNSPEKVKAAADFVTKSNVNNGVAYALDRYFA